MRRRRKVLSTEDLRYARTWSTVMAICWLGAAALRFVDAGGIQAGLSAWLSIATPLLFIASAVYYQNRLERDRDEANRAPSQATTAGGTGRKDG